MRRLPLIVLLLLLLGVYTAFPPMRFHSLASLRAVQASAQRGSQNDIETFWNDKLLPAAEKATDAAAVVQAIATDSKSVRDHFGRTVGVSSSYFLFLRGSG